MRTWRIPSRTIAHSPFLAFWTDNRSCPRKLHQIVERLRLFSHLHLYFSFLYFVIICNNKREAILITQLRTVHSLDLQHFIQLALYMYCFNNLHYLNHNIYTTYSTLLTNTVTTRGKANKGKNRQRQRLIPSEISRNAKSCILMACQCRPKTIIPQLIKYSKLFRNPSVQSPELNQSKISIGNVRIRPTQEYLHLGVCIKTKMDSHS